MFCVPALFRNGAGTPKDEANYRLPSQTGVRQPREQAERYKLDGNKRWGMSSQRQIYG